MTLREIAAEAGVSISTVSRVINQSTNSPVSREVQDRIWEIAKRTNYIPRHSKKNTVEPDSSPQNHFVLLPVSLHGFRMEHLIISSLHWPKILNRKHSVITIF